MMQCNVKRDLFTSLVGTVPLADVLTDLPLPSPLPTPMEETVLGKMKLSDESKKLLDSSNPVLCSRITEALLAVDTSFLDVKDSAQTVPYTPNAKDPPLIKVVMNNLLPQAVVRIEKLDPGLYNSPTKNVSQPIVPGTDKSLDAVVPSHVAKESHSTKKRKEKKRSQLSSSGSATPVSSSSVSETKALKKSRRLSSSSDETAPPRKKKHPRPLLSESPESLHVSIDCHSNLVTPETSKSLKQKQRTKNRGSSKSAGTRIQNNPAPRLPPLSTEELIVRVSRARLKGDFKLPYSGEVHGGMYREGGFPTERPLHRVGVQAVDVRNDRWAGKEEAEFAMAPGVSDRATNDEIKKVHKKKKKHSHHHHRGDQAKLAVLRRFTNMVDGLFDQNTSEDDLFNRMTLSEILSQVSSLKQQGILHEVSVDSLIQLIGLMDKHVLDSANLLINSVPDEMENAKLWRELARDRILRSADAALVILHIVTAPNMPKKVHLEESIDQILALTKFHLNNNIYPQFDPVYKAENKESGMLPRQKRRTGGQVGNKIINVVYHKLTEVVENMAVLTETQPLTDTTVLLLSSMGTLPFFVENVSLLQLSALRLVRAIFMRYDKHRDLILDEIFASLQRLPTNKRNLRSYKLFNGQYIQMLTALVLQLTQCIVMPPPESSSRDREQSTSPKEGKDRDLSIDKKPDIDVQMTNTYNIALKTGNNFLAKFLKKCSGGKDEDDFRPLFENFIQDLLTTLNLPMWPASEVFLTLLGMLLVQSFSNRSVEQSIRLMSLDHLGVIAARLRKDVTAPTSEQENEELVDILAQVIQTKLDRGTPSPTVLVRMDAFSENNQHLQKALIAYLNKQSESDQACAYARDFYIGQWLYDAHLELDRVLKENPSSPLEALNEDFPDATGEISSSGIALQQSELKKDTILSFLDSKKMTSFKGLGSVLDERSAAVVTRYLASSRALTKSFDTYLQKLIRVSNEPAVHVRTRAMKALSSIVAADPGILSRPDMQRAVEYRFCDMSTLVREAAVDLIGRFVLSRPELTSQYYDMICARIRDSGVSVRKRVIKILKDICVLQPDFPKVNEICVRIIKRISDEEAIKQLVTSVFRELWFTPLPPSSDQRELLLRRVTNITSVVGICKEYEWFEQLLEQILKNEDQTATQAVFNVCQKMVDCLVENVLSLDENSAKSSSSTSSLMSCIITLYLFCNVRPSLLLKHATTLHPYLSATCAANKDVMVLHFVSKILKEVVPLMEHPSESFLAGLEEDLVKLIMKHGQLLIHSCVECLGAVVNSVTHNYALVKDCFQRFFKCLEQMRVLQSQNPTSPQLKTHRASLLRSLFTVGVLCKFFNFDSIIPQSSGANPVSMRVYSHLIYFFKNGDEEIQIKTVKGLGLYCIRYPEMMLEGEIRNLINTWLTKDCASTKKIEVLRNIHNYLKEVETQLTAADTKWEKDGSTDKQNLLEFGDQHSSVSSNIAQAFLLPILESFFHAELQVRLGALQAIVLILRQGLVHPAQCVPYLMAMSTDPDSAIKIKADQHLVDHTSRYGHLMQTQLLSGLKKSYEFQKLIAGDGARGFNTDSIGNSISLLSHIYVLVRSNKQHRRVFLRVMLRYFEDYEKSPLGLLLYLADTLAYLPYNTLEEPLFVVHHIDMTISIAGSNLLQQFKEVFGGNKGRTDDEEDMAIIAQWNYDLNQLSDCCHSSQGCFLLLLLKQLLKKSYGLSDSKCQKYSPTESNKAFDKTANRRVGNTFNPKQVVAMVKQEATSARRILLSKEECIRQYLEFKQLMNKMDPFEGDEDGSDQEAPPPHSPSAPPISADPTSVKEPQKLEEVPRPPSRSRSSRASSSSSVCSRREKKDRDTPARNKKKKRIIVSSDSSGDEDSNWT